MENFIVYIIESPSDEDLYNKINEGEILSKSLKLAGINSEYKLIVNKKTLEKALKELVEYLKKPDAFFPILHVSTHGNKDGLELTSKEFISWKDFKSLIKPINDILNSKLIISVSSCEGFSAFSMAMSLNKPPFYVVIGNSKETTWSDTVVGFATFYHLLSKGYSVGKAVIAMRESSGNKNFNSVKAKKAQEIFLSALVKAMRKRL